MQPHDATPLGLFRSLRAHGALLGQITARDVRQRYRGSLLGVLWAFLQPLFMLAVYTFVFSFVFKARWGETTETTTEFAIILFSGLILHALFAETLGRAPSVILHHANFVKKVVFPLEILPLMLIGSALFHFGMSLLVLLVGQLFLGGDIPATILLLPVVALPFLMMTAGFAWILASMGVFIRDIGPLVGLLLTVLLFVSPIFYPMEALPEAWRPYLYLNPLTTVTLEARRVLLDGAPPHWGALLYYTAVATLVMFGGFWWFQKTRKAFSDVV